MQDEEEQLEQAHGRFEHATEGIPEDAAELTCMRISLMQSANEAMLVDLQQLVAQHPGSGVDTEMQKHGFNSLNSEVFTAEGSESRPGTAASLALGVGDI